MKLCGSIALFFVFATMCQGMSVTEGYLAGFRSVGVPVFGALCVDNQGVLYFAGDPDSDWLADTVFKVAPESETSEPFAEGFGNIAAIIQVSEGVFFLADNATNDAGFGDTVYRLQDVNEDGDCLDFGEVRLYLDTGTTDNVADIALSADGTLYVLDADGYGTGSVFRCVDSNHDNDARDSGELTVFAGNPSTQFLAGIAIDPAESNRILLCESSGNVYTLIDQNDDGDALDANEVILFANGLGGGYDILFDAEGDLFVSVSNWSTGEDKIWECKPDGNDPDTLSDSVSVFADVSNETGYITNLVLFPASSPFEPFSETGATLCLSYLDPVYMNPSDVMTFIPLPHQVPGLNLWGVLFLLLSVSVVLIRKNGK